MSDTPKTVAALKRWLSVGTRVKIVNHYKPDDSRDAVVLRNTSANLVLSHPRAENGSWIDWPKSAQFQPNENGTVTLLGGGAAQSALQPFVTIEKAAQ